MRPEHLSDGKFAPKEVAGSRKTSAGKRGRPFVKGDVRANKNGRPKGVPNKLTRDVKQFLSSLVASVRVQDAVEARIERGDAVAFFRALEHVLGKPKETTESNVTAKVVIEWKR